jgi:hypothetical protein
MPLNLYSLLLDTKCTHNPVCPEVWKLHILEIEKIGENTEMDFRKINCEDVNSTEIFK